MENTHH